MGRPTFNPLRDLLSGAIQAATSVPQLIAYAETVGYAGYRGLATAGPPLVAWGLVTGSPFMNAGVTSITALMTKSDLDGESYVQEHGEKAYVELVAAYSLLIGLASISLALIGFGRLAKSVPISVRRGFKWGCSVGVLVAALPNGLFLNGNKELNDAAQSNNFISEFIMPYKGSFPGLLNVTNAIYALSHPWLWGVVPAVMFVLGTWFVADGKKYLPTLLPPGSEVIMLTVLATAYSMQTTYQGGVVGEVPTIDRDAGVSLFGWKIPIEVINVERLLTEVPLVERFGGSWFKLAVSCIIFASINFLSIVGIASGFESEDGISWSAERELIAQGVSCGVAAVVGSAPVSGSLSRSLVSRMTGTTSQLACIFTAFAWIYLQPFMSIMTATPKAALSAVILSAVLKGVCIPKDLLKLTRIDGVVGWLTGIVTAITSPTQGFGFGLVLYMLTSAVAPKLKKD